MRILFGLFSVMFLLTSCKEQAQEKAAETPATDKEVAEVTEFGAGVNAETAATADAMAAIYKDLKETDTLETAFEATVTEVCQMKGCWMKVDLGNEQTAMVRFKDYGFFMPKDLAGKKVVMEGKAFVELMSVEDRKHYAEDAGSSVEEIEAITEPKTTFSFEASGVAIK